MKQKSRIKTFLLVRMEDIKMTNKTISEQLTFLVQAIIKDWTYPKGQELTLKQRQELVVQLKKIVHDSDDLDEARIITDAFYKDKVMKHFRSMDTNFSWIFEILQHELVSASRLKKLLLDLAHEEHFSDEGINKINHYFAESCDHGDNDNFVTLSSSDVIDSISRAKEFQINHNDKNNDADRQQVNNDSLNSESEDHLDNIIKLKDY